MVQTVAFAMGMLEPVILDSTQAHLHITLQLLNAYVNIILFNCFGQIEILLLYLIFLLRFFL